MVDQFDWRSCGKCQVLTYDGFLTKGPCPAGGVHKAWGFNYDMWGGDQAPVETPVVQVNWRHCGACHAFFYDGFSDKGQCPAGGGHQAAGWYFGNYHGPLTSPPSPREQGDWRYCGKCHALFFDGLPTNKGRCPAGGGHEAAGWTFVLGHIEANATDWMDTQERQTWVLVKDAHLVQGGCSRLEVDPRLVVVARAHSEDLAVHPGLWDKKTPEGFPGHYGSDGSLASGSGGRIAQAVGSPGAENVFRGRIRGNIAPPGPDTAFNAWWNSPSHKATMLNCNHNTSGVGIAFGNDPDGWTSYYFTQVFHS
ncbi:CAP domain-containing protein [Streptomyces sp. NPDC021100]|uniref:CAP domain-containing protein n=1 Tax=Streptomyces sp. NPDC021100 TaxID=3365114 RepID=UPI00378CDD84